VAIHLWDDLSDLYIAAVTAVYPLIKIKCHSEHIEWVDAYASCPREKSTIAAKCWLSSGVIIMKLEICCFSLGRALTAKQAGADRIEFRASRSKGG